MPKLPPELDLNKIVSEEQTRKTFAGVFNEDTIQRIYGLVTRDYFRELEHVGIHEDFKFGYRPKPSEEEMRRLNPILRLEAFGVAPGMDDGYFFSRYVEALHKIPLH